MASIDINKLIQESMAATMSGDQINENADADATTGAVDTDDMSVLEGTMMDKAREMIGSGKSKAKSVVNNFQANSDKANAGQSAPASTPGIKDRVAGTVAGAVKTGKKLAGDVKDTVAAHPGAAAGAAAGAAGLLGSGMMAKKYLKRKKK